MTDDEWTVERHLTGKPDQVVALHERFVELVAACGPFGYAVARTAVTMRGARRGFAGAVLTSQSLDGHVDLQRV
jgi:hypothetical protein